MSGNEPSRREHLPLCISSRWATIFYRPSNAWTTNEVDHRLDLLPRHHSIYAGAIKRLGACCTAEGSERSGNVPTDFASDCHSPVLRGEIRRIGSIGRPLTLAR